MGEQKVDVRFTLATRDGMSASLAARALMDAVDRLDYDLLNQEDGVSVKYTALLGHKKLKPTIDVFREFDGNGISGRASVPVRRVEYEDDGGLSVILDEDEAGSAGGDVDADDLMRRLATVERECSMGPLAASGFSQLQAALKDLRRGIEGYVAKQTSRREDLAEGREHLTASGTFQSDKYPTVPAGKVPLSVEDVMAQDLLWTYAQRRRVVDAEFSRDLEEALQNHGYEGSQERQRRETPQFTRGTHPSHDTRFSDSSLYDEKCKRCGVTGGMHSTALSEPCPEVPPGVTFRSAANPIVGLPDGQLQCMACENVWPNEVPNAAADALAEDYGRLKRLGSRLCEAAMRVVGDYDGVHRLARAVSEWNAAVADEGGRGADDSRSHDPQAPFGVWLAPDSTLWVGPKDAMEWGLGIEHFSPFLVEKVRSLMKFDERLEHVRTRRREISSEPGVWLRQPQLDVMIDEDVESFAREQTARDAFGTDEAESCDPGACPGALRRLLQATDPNRGHRGTDEELDARRHAVDVLGLYRPRVANFEADREQFEEK